MIRVRIVRESEARPLVVPVSSPRPGFAARPGEIGKVGGQWLVTLGLEAEETGALVAARIGGETRVAVDMRGVPIAAAVAFATGVCLRAWRYDGLHGGEAAPKLERLDLVTDQPGRLRRAWEPVEAMVDGVTFARNLVAEPSDTLTPSGFLARLDALAEAGVTVDVLDRRALRRQGMGGLLAVGAGSAHKPALAVLRWRGSIAADPVVFVGKGITFDTGGLCIKPADGMEDMRADMAGAAACAGAMLTLARRCSPAPAAAVLALAENATGAASYRPSDVVRMGAGLWVEVVDTDAEGRMVLADALDWAVRRLRPAAIVDLATLTGSIVTALGDVMAGLFGHDPAFAAYVAAAGAAVGEPVWRMPIGRSHRKDLESAIADLRHCVPGRGQPDACHAAAFLRAFVPDTIPWAHLDIAGMAVRAKADDRYAAGPTGYGVRLLDRLVAQSFEDPHR
ncbi:MAG: leucyl aminopeptidase family protein [Acetobacteraceae bacterium]